MKMKKLIFLPEVQKNQAIYFFWLFQLRNTVLLLHSYYWQGFQFFWEIKLSEMQLGET